MQNQLRIAFFVAAVGAFAAVASPRTVMAAQAPAAARSTNLCTTEVQIQPAARGGGAAAAGRGGPGAPGGAGAPGGQARGGGAGRGNQPAFEPPRLVKIREDVYLITNVDTTTASIGAQGGNVTVYLTNDGVILVDSKNPQMHDDIVAKVKSLTDRPIKYVVLTHNHGDHSGGAARMQEIGATVVISKEDRENMARTNPPVLPQVTYHGEGQIFLGGKEVQLREFCGHTNGDTVAYLPAARVVVVGDLITTPDTIPQIVNYGDRGNWTDMGRTLDEIAKMEFDFLVGGHGPLLTKQEFLTYKDKLSRLRERVRELTRQGRSQEEVAQAVLKEFNYTNAGQVGQMMQELK